MNEPDLRSLVRDVVARRLRERAAVADARARLERAVAPGCQDHPSHAMYVTIVNTDEACVIEPGARCDHCGYCKSHGH
jgi:hypothetical protein